MQIFPGFILFCPNSLQHLASDCRKPALEWLHSPLISSFVPILALPSLRLKPFSLSWWVQQVLDRQDPVVVRRQSQSQIPFLRGGDSFVKESPSMST